MVGEVLGVLDDELELFVPPFTTSVKHSRVYSWSVGVVDIFYLRKKAAQNVIFNIPQSRMKRRYVWSKNF